MTSHQSGYTLLMRKVIAAVIVFVGLGSGTALAQEVRYSWLDLSYVGQDIDRQGTQLTPVPNQTTDVDAQDGDGVRFRGSFGTWNNLYVFGDYQTADIDVAAVVNNDTGFCPCFAEDEFDLTTIRGGIGVRWPVAFATDLYLEASYDSIDLDFGSFAGDNFDMDDKGVGAALGVRHMLNDDILVYLFGRFSNHGDLDLDTLEFDTGAYYGTGFGWEIVRGLSLVGEYEGGEFARWSIGFRLDLDED